MGRGNQRGANEKRWNQQCTSQHGGRGKKGRRTERKQTKFVRIYVHIVRRDGKKKELNSLFFFDFQVVVCIRNTFLNFVHSFSPLSWRFFFLARLYVRQCWFCWLFFFNYVQLCWRFFSLPLFFFFFHIPLECKYINRWIFYSLNYVYIVK